MSHFAKVENNKVVDVIVAEQNHIDTLEGNWIQTSYNTFHNTHKENKIPLRGNFAGIGYIYDENNDVFYPQQPYTSWTLNTEIWDWESPVPFPNDHKNYIWNESTTSWDAIE